MLSSPVKIDDSLKRNRVAGARNGSTYSTLTSKQALTAFDISDDISSFDSKKE